MNEITKVNFEYALVSEETARLLKSKKNQLDGIYFRYTSEVGQVLYEAQQELADYNNHGLFAKWVEAAGFKRQRAYEYINIYKYAVRITDNEELEFFEKQPKSIQTEMSKPSAIPEVNQSVYNGDIKTHKEYKDLEKQLKQQEEMFSRQIKDKDEVINNTYKQLEKAQQQEPQVIEKTVEVAPADYEDLKESNVTLLRELQKLEQESTTLRQAYDSLISKQKEEEEGSKRYKELTEAIEEMEGKMTRGQKRIQAQKQVYELVDKSKELLIAITPIPYIINAEFVNENEYARKALLDISKQVDKFSKNLSRVLDNQVIIEGEFINE